MKQVIRINAEYDFTEKEEKEWLDATDEAREERINMAKEVLSEMLEDEDFKFLELSVEVK
jgi:hypothetical protein